MLPFSFKNRIAFNYIISTALLILLVFFVIFYIVRVSVYSHLESDIRVESEKLLEEIKVENNTFHLIDQHEWKEKEHNTLDVNPIFIQFVDATGAIIDKSPNLKKSQLYFRKGVSVDKFHDDQLDNSFNIRQSQVPIYQNSTIVGYILIAVSLEDATIVLHNLSQILFVLYPLTLMILFIIARIIAGRSIKPVASIIETSNTISRENLKSRIPLPNNKDELFVLSQTINNLLDRIENAVEREKQFTSDASHELRTPLAVIKGTLEVLVRKPRDQKEYEEKINYCVKEVDRLNFMVDELLLLARLENQKQSLKAESVFVNAIILDGLARYSEKIRNKNLQITNHFESDIFIKTDSYLFSIIVDNLLSNALKYSEDNGKIEISLRSENDTVFCSIKDNGIGILEADLDKISNPFYRSRSSDHPEVKGTGLGLSIVKRLCGLLQMEFHIQNNEDKGVNVTLVIKNL
ncbi:sensor histidine kinase [Flavobacterium soli]|uniref:sensor histidine kinase n=1 Tax=Flavobacterium soli TaxID=344881 RepID=UPI000409B008|nr:ATP-binding protein [Flavobacterium soli]